MLVTLNVTMEVRSVTARKLPNSVPAKIKMAKIKVKIKTTLNALKVYNNLVCILCAFISITLTVLYK